ncbi:MAG: choice-of-anchor D domain-containing protein [Myxococcales bacterium]|nr:choice-of-anchor D domain-containing protein [Myxococcales bacterium]
MSRALTRWAIPLLLSGCSATGDATPGTDAAGDDTATAVDASAPAAVLSLTPSTVSFGAVVGGTAKVLSVLAVNVGTVPAWVGALTVVGSPDFHVLGVYDTTAEACAGLSEERLRPLPFTGPPGDTFCIDVEYRPFGGGDDVGLLQVNPPLEPTLALQEPIASAALQGYEIGPEIWLKPVALDFGPLDVGDQKELTFTIENQGDAELVIEAVRKGETDFEIFDAISVVPEVPADSVVAPSSTTGFKVTVRFNPTQNYPVTYSTIGFIEVLSNDADEPIAYVKVTAQTKSAKLQVTPTPLIDFGIVAETTPGSTRTVTFTNVGTADLEVTGLAIENNAENEFSIDDVVEDPLVIEPNNYRIVNLRYKNTGGAEGEVETAKLVFASSDLDPAAPTSVDLRASRVKEAFCVIELDPVKVDFGTIGYGFEKTMTLNIRNVGSAPCSPFSVSVGDGPDPSQPGSPPGNCEIPNGDKSGTFIVTNEPPAIKDLLQPGQSLPLQVKFAPTASIWSSISLDGLTTLPGIVHVTMLDYANPDVVNGTDYTVVSAPPGKIGDEVICNLEAKSGVANMAAIPTEVAFEKTTVGCASKMTDITLHNTGAAPLDVCGITLNSCGPEFKLKNIPAIPPCVDGAGGIKLAEAAPILFGVVYVPQDTSKDGCAIVVTSGDAETTSLTIPLSGEGASSWAQTDSFTQLSGQVVDVLFVVDENLPLTQSPAHLEAEFNGLASEVASWPASVHVGVISNNIASQGPEVGRLRTAGAGQPRFLTGGASGGAALVATLEALGAPGGVLGGGLDAAWRALSFPNTAPPADPPKSCNVDSDCTKPQVCVQSVLNAGTTVCAGWNWEFFREDAALELVFISDVEDSSLGNLSFYIDVLKNVKGPGESDLVRAHAVVGDSGTGCESTAGKAFPGDRYIEVATQLGGKVGSICASTWASVLSKTPGSPFGLDTHFPLTRAPLPETIDVVVAGDTCTTGWEYQEDTSAILFDANGPCMPQENETIEITYNALCYSE